MRIRELRLLASPEPIIMSEPDLSQDWVSRFLEYTDNVNSPEIFRLWSGITAVSGALERRVWIRTPMSLIFPNLFTLLVGAPGSGKTQAVSPVEALWRLAGKFFVAPHSVTRASLLDALERADRKIVMPKNVVEYHTLLVAADEFGVLCPGHDLEFLSVMNRIYDNPPYQDEERRHVKKETKIMNPQLIILAGTQPAFLNAILPQEAWTMGFTSRLIMIYSAKEIIPDIFSEADLPKAEKHKGALISGLVDMSSRIGGFNWEPEAKLELKRWADSKFAPIPTHTRLVSYNQRRWLHTLKLAMISAMSRGPDLTLTLFDLVRGRDWLLAAEQVMPDIFREMNNRSDAQVIDELHYFLWRQWVLNHKPFHESLLIHFLSSKVPSDKILRVIEMAERGGVLAREAGNSKMYTPRPRQDHGVE